MPDMQTPRLVRDVQRRRGVPLHEGREREPVPVRRLVPLPEGAPDEAAREKGAEAARAGAGQTIQRRADHGRESPGGGRDIFDSLGDIQKDLDLLAGDIDRLLVGRSAFHGAWAFPMLDGQGRTVGIRLREYGGSRKWSVAGSRDGLFYDPELEPRDEPCNGVRGRELVVVEGATDCIAGYALGLPCVGRSACSTGVEALRDLCARLLVSRVTIVSDNDEYKFRPDGTPWRPGEEGAHALAHRLGRTYRIVTPPKKDLREWLYAGLTSATFWKVASLQPWKARSRGPALFPPLSPKPPFYPHTPIRGMKRSDSV